MFEARLAEGKLLKQIVEATKDLVTDANLDCSATGISMQVCFAAKREGVEAARPRCFLFVRCSPFAPTLPRAPPPPHAARRCTARVRRAAIAPPPPRP
jgi:hypothetical protein